MNLFKKPQQQDASTQDIMRELDEVLKKARVNPAVVALLVKYIRNELPTTSALVMIWEQSGRKVQTFWECAGMEPAQAILALDQLHHRIQHEGLKNYD